MQHAARTRSFEEERARMVETQIAARGVHHPGVLEAMQGVPRDRFVPEHLVEQAYADCPLSIGEEQTISQPYIVAAMIEAAQPRPGDRALEVGTGSGYSAAVLSRIVSEVYTVECLAGLAEAATRRLAALGYTNVHVRTANGTLGWPEHAPYDVIIVTAGGPKVPPPLLGQLAVGGRLVMPVGTLRGGQRLVRVLRHSETEFDREELEGVAFVPLIGREGWHPEELQS